MTARRDPDLLIRAFLDEGQTELPDRAYEAVRAEIDHTRQRVVIGPWRLPNMSNRGRFAVAAATVVAVVAVGINLLPKEGGFGGPGTSPSAPPSAEAQPSTTTPPAPAPSPTPSPTDTSSIVSNGWIAYATMPRDGDDEGRHGSDIYLIREDSGPILIAGRDGGLTWNLCPAFAPDGTRLAFGQQTDIELGQRGSPGNLYSNRAIVVLQTDANGSITDTARIAVAGIGPAACPKWSLDGTRVAYLEAGAVVVRGLDGSTRASAGGDPVAGDFDNSLRIGDQWALLSPAGDWTVRQEQIGIVVARPDGTDERTISLSIGPPYAISAWSPDGRQVLLMQDVSGFNFTMHALSVEPPFSMVTVVANVPVNNSHSWPGHGDVSWQPVTH